jgi:YVTN family beta-propeller protein
MRFAWLFVPVVGLSCSTKIVDEPAKPGAFPSSPAPIAIPAEGAALVTNNGSDDISVLDLAKNAVTAQPLIALDPIANNGPHHAKVDTRNGFVYTPLAFPPPKAAPGPHGNHGIAAVPGKLLKLSLEDLSRVDVSTVDVNPGEIAMTPDGSKLVVSHFDLQRAVAAAHRGAPVEEMRARVLVVDARSMLTTAAITACVAPHGMDLSPDGKTAYVACYGEDALGIVDLAAGSVTRVPVGAAPGQPGQPLYGPYSVFVSADGSKLVLGLLEGKALVVIDAQSRSVLRSIPMSGATYFGAQVEGTDDWIVPTQLQDTVVRVDTVTGQVKKSRPTPDCSKPHQTARFKGRYFVVCEGDHVTPSVVLEIDPDTLETIRDFKVGAYPDAIIFVEGPR